ncbi:MAG: protein kinase [Planctomycetota bacterium]
MAVSLEQFVENLIRSGLFSAAELAAFQNKLAPEKRPKDAQGLARELNRAGKLTKYQAAQVYQGKTRGLVLGDYVILDEIGHGGMGQVCQAWRRERDRTVAVKVLPAKAMQSPQAVERFHREVKAAARLEHPNIVAAYDAGEAEGIHFLVMQYVEGQDLAHAVAERGPLPVEEAVGYVIQAARGLEYAHRQGVVHRDIKPGNLLLDSEGAVKVLDMGLARMDQPARATDPTAPDALTASGQVMGTYDYMAPEQAQDTHSADHRADIYSLGCTLYRLVTGRKPYVGETPVQILLAHCQDPIPSLCDLREDVSPKLDAVSQKMLAKNPADRQQSMGEVIADLEGCLHPPGPEPPTPPPVQGRATESSSSTDSALKAFLKTMSRVGTAARQAVPSADEETRTYHPDAETAMPVGRPTAPSARRKKTTPWAIIGGIVGLLVILALGIALLGRTPISEKPRESAGAKDREQPTDSGAAPAAGEPRSYLILRWPEADRADAKLSIDDLTYDLSGPWVQSTPDEIKIAVRPGSHKLWIARRGFEPIEERFQAVAGKDYTIRPEWRTAAGLVERAEAEPEPESPTPTPTPTTSDVAELPRPSEPEPMEPETPALDPEAQKRLEAEKRYAEAIKPIDDLIAAWNFREASAALSKLQFEEQDLAARLAAWRNSVARLVDLKARIITKINTADPPLRTTALLIRGAGRDLIKAEDDGLTTKLRNGETEPLPWSNVEPQALDKLIELVSTSNNSDDRLAAGVLALASKDPTTAEKLFEQAQTLGAEIGPYLAPLASAAFARARELLDRKEFTEADAAIASLEAKYANIPWFASNEQAIAAARNVAKIGIVKNQEAENLYAEALEVFGKKELWDLRDLVEKLKSDYADTNAVRDRRRPSLLELEKAVADVPKAITVRLDGTGDFKSIQAAIDAAPPKSLIEIGDDGPYHEKVLIPKDKYELRMRGKKGCWPVITSADLSPTPPCLVTVEGSGAFLERLVLLHDNPRRVSQVEACLLVLASDFRLRRAIVHGEPFGIYTIGYQRKWECEECLVTGHTNAHAPAVFRNCLMPRTTVWFRFKRGIGSEAHFCVILAGGGSDAAGCIYPTTRDSIINNSFIYFPPGLIERCAVLQGDLPEHAGGCFKADPMFVDPENFDYRLKPGSPCIGKASDGGDIGCRYTPEMEELCKVARELRRKGILKF